MKIKALIGAALVVTLGLTTAGCITSERKYPGPKRVAVDKDAYFFGTDATRRYIMTVEREMPGTATTRRITCAEPSPDVAVATSQAFSAAIMADGRGPSGRGDAEGKINAGVASSAAEAIAQLGARTATIQLLRDNLYRACEAYANGAIDEAMYALIVSRVDDVMVTLLTAEIMGGASAQLAAAASPSTAAGANLFGGEGGPSGSTTADTLVGDGPGGGGGAGLSYAGARGGGGADAMVAASTAGFVQLHSNYINDVNANRTSLGVACLSMLSGKQDRIDATLAQECRRYMSIAMPASFGVNPSNPSGPPVMPPRGSEYLPTYDNN